MAHFTCDDPIMRLLLSLGLVSWIVGTATAAEPARLIGESRVVAQRVI